MHREPSYGKAADFSQPTGMATIQIGENEQHPDLALVASARTGDVHAFETLVNKYDRQIFRIAQHITQNREDAQDVVQDAFLKAYEKLDQFQGNSKFYTWLVRIAVNESLMRLRKRRTGKMVSIDDDIETEEGSVPRDLADWSTVSYSFRFSTDGVNWTNADQASGASWTISRAFTLPTN